MQVEINELFTLSFLRYLLLGLYEELFNRGIIQTALSHRDPKFAAIISAGLFGLVHMSHFVVGDQSTFETVLQIFRATAWGLGASALRIYTNTIAPLVFLHALTDDFEHFVRLQRMVSYPTSTSWSWIAQLHPILQLAIWELPFYLMGLYGFYLLGKISRRPQLVVDRQNNQVSQSG
jgi:hypothetical protein